MLRAVAGGADALRIARAVALVAGVREGCDPRHAERVADLAAAIATAMGLDRATADRCAVAGWLHDIGMVALPDRALSPADPAAEAACPELRAHALIGAELVRRVAELADVAPAVRHHHERWDGGGYPDGLIGGAIPLEARVIGIADLVACLLPDARSDPRVRKQVAHRLRQVAGSVADPAGIEAALRVLADEAAGSGEYLRIA